MPECIRPRRAALVLALLLCAAASAGAQTVPKPDPLQGDGRISSFYTWEKQIPHEPGKFLRAEPLPAVLGLANAGEQSRILYSSTNGVDGTTPTVVSGALFLPKGAPPAGGWPIVAWAHGTVGIADICAPSWSARSYRDVAYLNVWLEQGYAVVATDYQGLGTPGPHPYLNARVEAYSVLDSIRAVLAHEARLANKVVIIGQSQGGGAAFATAAYAPQYAKELNLRGTVATGVPYFGPNVPRAGSSDPTRVDPGIAYIFYLILMAQQTDPALSAADLLSPVALPLFEQSRSACIYELEDDVELAALSDATALRPELFPVLGKHFADLEYPTVALKQPVFIGSGAEDRDVNPATQAQLVKDSCAAGTIVEAHVYKGLNHSQTVSASLRESVPFVKKVFAGQPVTPACSPIPE